MAENQPYNAPPVDVILTQEDVQRLLLWASILNKPTTFPPETHNHNTLYDVLGAAAAAILAHKDLTTGVHGVGAGTIAKLSDLAQDSNLSALAQAAITASHAAVTAGTGISLSGQQVSVADTAVTPGAYTSANITVDQQGRITAAASGGAQKLVAVSYAERTTTFSENNNNVPFDDTVPQDSEMSADVLTVAHTPASADNYLIVLCNVPMSGGASGTASPVAGLFRDSEASALAVAWQTIPAQYVANVPLQIRVDPDDTDEITFRLKVGVIGSTATAYVGGGAAGRYFGGVLATTMLVLEYAP